MYKSRVVSLAAIFLAAMSCMSMAHASFVLYLDDPSTTGTSTQPYDVILSDDQLSGFATSSNLVTTTSDNYAGLGTINYSGAVGTNFFTINITTGISKPVGGGLAHCI